MASQNELVTIIGPSFDLTAIANITTLTTSSLRFRVMSIALEILTATTVTILNTGSLGVTSSGYVDIAPALISGSGVVGTMNPLVLVANPAIVPASTAIVYRNSIGATASALTGRIHMTGYYLL